MSFESDLQFGRVAEGLIASWIMARGSAVLPAYEIEKASGKGPRLFTQDAPLIAPDMLTFSHKGLTWIEAKHKSVFTWYRKSREWVTGIDLRHYQDYVQVSKTTGIDVWLMFFHKSCTPSDGDLKYGCPQQCPSGLFGEKLSILVENEHHIAPRYDPSRERMQGHGASGMVYWAYDDLRYFATADDVFSCAINPIAASHPSATHTRHPAA